MRTTHYRGQIPAPALLVIGGVSLYMGAALAIGLFDRLSPAAVAVVRILGAGVFLVAWRRPTQPAWRGRRLARAIAFGLATALMNVAFYEAIARLPLGTAVAIEFCGPVAVAALASRRPRDITAVLLAAVGVVMIADVRWSGSPAGVTWAIAAAGMWSAYIVLGKRVARGGNGVDDMAAGLLVAGVVLSPLVLIGGDGNWTAMHDPTVLLLGVSVGILSSVIPYALDQVVVRRVGQARFAVLLALLPAAATIIGLIALRQVPGPLEALGIAAVVAAVAFRPAMATRLRRRT